MTLLGKILTVLILVMSVLFMAFSIAVYGTHRNWHEEVTGVLRPQVAALNNDNDQLRNEIESLQANIAYERASRASAIAALESSLQERTNDRDTLEVEKNRLDGVVSERTARLEIAQSQLATLSGETQTLRGDINSAIAARDSLFGRVVALTDSLGQASGTLESLKAYRTQLIAQIARAKLVLDRHGLDENTQVFDVPPRIDGVVTAVRKDFIEVTIGFDEGLREGHHLEIYRGNTYLGRAVVRKADPDRSVAEILKGFRQGSIQEGDKVATRTKIS